MSTAKRYIIVLAVLIGCVGCDQTVKTIARTALSENATHSFLGDTVRLQLTRNEGAFLGLGASLPQAWRAAVLVGGVGVVLLALLAYLLLRRGLTFFNVLALALIFAGGVSNLVDRLAHDGRVIDFLNVGLGPLRTGIFNGADVAITCGVAILLLQELRIPRGG